MTGSVLCRIRPVPANTIGGPFMASIRRSVGETDLHRMAGHS